MQAPTLNPDILATVVSFASRGAISVMMQTSRFFYHEGPKTLLRDGVAFENDKDVLTFLLFMRAEGRTRSRYLTGLAIVSFDDGDVMREDSAQLLAHFLNTSSFDRLRELRIEDSEELFGRYPYLLAAFKTLSGIEAFALESCSWLACGLVDRVGGSMRTVTLAYGDNEDTMPVAAQDIHPLVLLQRSCATLEKLEVRFMDAYLPRSLYPPSFPNVNELLLAWCSYPLLSPYIHAFPHLRCLNLDTTYDEADFNQPGVLDSHRQANRMEQLQHGSWKTLDEVFGDVADVYVSGLTSQVRRLSLAMQHSSFEMLGDVVNDTRPSYLWVSVERQGAFDSASGIPAVLGRTGAKDLEVLKLQFRLAPEEKDIDVPEALERLVGTFKELPLKGLELVFGCFDLPVRREGMKLGSRFHLPQCRVEQYLEHVNLDDLGHHFLDTVPTLREVTLSIRGHRARDDDDAAVVKMEVLVNGDS